MKTRELESQILDFIDGRLNHDEENTLVETLINDADALEHYYQYVLVDSALTRLIEGKMALTEEDSIAAIAQKRSRFRSLEFTALAVAAIVTLTLFTLRLILIEEVPPTLTFRAAPDTHFEITHSEEHRDTARPGTLAIGSRLQLSQGSMELKFSSGVRAIVQAPVDLTLNASDQLFLREGTAWFGVPPAAHGFQVLSPELHVTDLGTEFGILASPDASDEIHVFKGKVRARSLNPRKTQHLLTSGQARLSDPTGRLIEIPVRPPSFRPDLPTELPHVHFNFEQQNGTLEVLGTHPDLPTITASLISTNPSANTITGVSGAALSLRGEGDHVRTNWPGLSGTTPRSVAFWLRIPPDVQQASSLPAAVVWGDPTSGLNAKWKITVVSSEDDPQARARLSFGMERYDGSTPLNDGHWHHFVTSYTGRSMDSGLPEISIYIDGKPEALTRNLGKKGILDQPTEVRTLTRSIESIPLMIGAPESTQPNSFVGDLDELYIFEGVISHDTIEDLRSIAPAP